MSYTLTFKHWLQTHAQNTKQQAQMKTQHSEALPILPCVCLGSGRTERIQIKLEQGIEDWQAARPVELQNSP